MPLKPNGNAPYAPPSAVTNILDAYRDRGLGTPVTADVLVRAGVTESLAPRTLQALRLLELIDKDGQPTDQFAALRQARGEEFNTVGQEWLRGVFAEVLQYADPSTAGIDRLTEAFRGYSPNGQRVRMATLLVGLWEYVGLPVPKPERGATTTAPSRKPSAPTAKKRTPTPPAPTPASGDLPPALVGMLQQIPRGGAGWTVERRGQFLTAFAGVLDFSVPITLSDGDAGVADDAEAEVEQM